MFLTSYIFKSKAVRALKGNWQTALIVSFLAGLPGTLNLMLRSTQMPELPTTLTYDALLAASKQITPATLWLLGGASVLSFIVTPVLAVGCNQYFIKRIQGEDLGIIGVLSRRKIFFRALLLYVFMYARILLWSLLLIVPGIIAALRYAMAPYFLAENPELTPSEAISKSKEAMADKKLSLLVLLISFLGWVLLGLVVQMFLSFSVILALVAYQFVELFRATYMNASVTAFYLAASRTEGIDKAKKEADAFVREIQSRTPYGRAGDLPDDRDKDDEDNAEEDKPGEDKP